MFSWYRALLDYRYVHFNFHIFYMKKFDGDNGEKMGKDWVRCTQYRWYFFLFKIFKV